MKRILLLLLLCVSFLIPCSAQKSKTLTNIEKAQIIKEILIDTVDDNFLQRGLRLDEKKDVVNLSLKNIPRNLIPHKVKGVKFQLSTPEEVEEKSKTGFGYYVFEEFNVDGSKMRVSFNNYWRNTDARAFMSGSIDYYYRKISGKWKRVKKTQRPNGIS
jgi:hypothetical protein